MPEANAQRGVSASAAAAHIGVSLVTFSKLLNTGVIHRQPRDVGYDLTTVRIARLRQLEAAAAARSGVDGGALVAKERALLAREQREAAQIRNQYARGELVSLDAIQKALEELFIGVREIALGTAGKVSDAVSTHTKEDREAVFTIIDEEIRAMLTLLSTGDVVSKAQDRKRHQIRRASMPA